MNEQDLSQPDLRDNPPSTCNDSTSMPDTTARTFKSDTFESKYEQLSEEIVAMYKIRNVLKGMPPDRSEKILKAVKILLEP